MQRDFLRLPDQLVSACCCSQILSAWCTFLMWATGLTLGSSQTRVSVKRRELRVVTARVAVLRSAAVVTIYNFTDGGWSVGRVVELPDGHLVHGLVFRDADSPSLIVSRETTATVCLPVEEEGSSRTSWDDIRVQGGCVAYWGNDVLLVARRNNVLAVMQAGGGPEFHDVGIRKPYLQTPLNSIVCVPGVGFAFRRCSGSVVFLNWAGVEMAKAGCARESVSVSAV